MEKEEVKNTKKKTGASTAKKSTTKKSTKSSSTKSSTKKTTSVKKEVVANKPEEKVETKVVEEKVVGKKKSNNEILRFIIVGIVLVLLIAGSFIVTVTKKTDKYRYQTHTGINEISESEYMEIIKEDGISIIYVARPTCSYCQMFEPVLTEVLKEYKIGVEYIDISAISTQDEWNEFYNSNEFLSSGEWGTPTLMIYKNKELYKVNAGYVDKDTLVNFLVENELIKGDTK